MKTTITIRFIFAISLSIASYFSNGQTISIIGPATPAGNWDTDFNLTQDGGNPDIWSTTIILTANEVKFRLDGAWTNNCGNTSFPSGTAILAGPNISVSMDATYIVTFNTSTLAYYFTLTGKGNVGIGTETPHPSAVLDAQSPEKGLLIPRMTIAQRGAIVSPQTGLLIFQTDYAPGFYYNAGTPGMPDWQMINGNGNFNTAAGRSALQQNTSGSNNTGMGSYALFSNTEGSNNTAYGVNALYSSLFRRGFFFYF